MPSRAYPIMKEELEKWLNFLCSRKSFHNLCISYPMQVEPLQYLSIHSDINKIIIEKLKEKTKHPDTSFKNSDLLVFEQQDNALSIKDLELLEDFTKSSALYLPSKIIILWGPKVLSSTVSNKILKLLEDPPVALSFIFLGYSYSNLLPTIRSRFLNWRMNSKQLGCYITQHPEFSYHWKNLKNSEEFESWAQENNLSIEQCLAYLWRFNLTHCNSAPKIESMLAFQQWFEKSQLWNNPVGERWYFLFQMVKNSLQSRIVNS